MSNTIHALACSSMAALALAACVSPGATPMTGSQQAPHAATHPVYLRAMKTHLSTPRAAVGPLYAGTHCMPKGEVIWDDALFRQVSYQLPKIFRRDAKRAHYRVPPDTELNANTPASMHPEYVEVDMQVQEVNATLCMQEEGASGSARMKVFWQVYAAGATTPVYESETEGAYDAPVMEKLDAADFFSNAFSAALQNLLSNPGFREAVALGSPR